MKTNQNGFGIVWVFVIIIIAALIGAAGWVVYDRQNEKNVDDDAVTSVGQLDKNTASEEIKKPENIIKYSTYDKDNIVFEYPEGWIVDGTASFASLKSPDFNSEGLQAIKINSGAFIEASQTNLPQQDRTADNFQTWGDQYVGDIKNAKLIAVNGIKVVQFDTQHRDGENGTYAWDSTTSIFFRSNGTRVEVRFGYKVGDKQTYNAAYQHVLDTLVVK